MCKVYTADFYYNETGHGEASGTLASFNQGERGRRYFSNEADAAEWAEGVVKVNYAIGRFEVVSVTL